MEHFVIGGGQMVINQESERLSRCLCTSFEPSLHRTWLDMPSGKTAKDNKRDFPPEVVDAVFKDFCVDDLLKSFSSEEHAIDISKQ